jgi:hypothetical protein
LIKARSNVVFLLHGKGGSPEGSVRKLEEAFTKHWPGLQYSRPLLPHHDPAVAAEASVAALQRMEIPPGATLVGISLGGLVAAKLQESGRPDLRVMAISAPTSADGVLLESRPEHRVAVYSSSDAVISGRVNNWPELAQAYDFDWLSHDTDIHLKEIVRLFDWWLEGTLAGRSLQVRNPASTRRETDDLCWVVMASKLRPGERSLGLQDSGVRPKNYKELGEWIRRGWDWDLGLREFLNEFLLFRHADFFACEPLDMFSDVQKAFLAGMAEYLSRVYGLAIPSWVQKPEYFLSYRTPLTDGTELGDFQLKLMQESDEYAFLLAAQTPPEFLKRNILAPARSLIVI